MTSDYAQMMKLLREVKAGHDDVMDVAVLDSSGLMIASTLDAGERDNILAAEAARLWDSTDKASQGIGLGEAISAFTFSEHGNMLVEPLPQGRMIVFLLAKKLTSGDLYVKLQKNVEKIRSFDL